MNRKERCSETHGARWSRDHHLCFTHSKGPGPEADDLYVGAWLDLKVRTQKQQLPEVARDICGPCVAKALLPHHTVPLPCWGSVVTTLLSLALSAFAVPLPSLGWSVTASRPSLSFFIFPFGALSLITFFSYNRGHQSLQSSHCPGS